MKIKYIFYVTVVFLFISSCSISKKLERKIVGKYAVEMLKSGNTNTPVDAYDGLLKDLLKGSYIQFNNDKTYTLKLAGKELKGSWYISDDGKTILTDNKDFKFRIAQFTETGLNLENINKGNTILMILKKINE